MKNGYPRCDVFLLPRPLSSLQCSAVSVRFFINLGIRALADSIVEKYGRPGQKAMLFPSKSIASRCLEFIKKTQSTAVVSAETLGCNEEDPHILDLIIFDSDSPRLDEKNAVTAVTAVLYPTETISIAARFWQHTGDGISSRRGEFLQQLFAEGRLKRRLKPPSDRLETKAAPKGPKRYQKGGPKESQPSGSLPRGSAIVVSSGINKDDLDFFQYVEERFGRNLGNLHAKNAKLAIRRRIAGKLEANIELSEALAEMNYSKEGNGGRGISEQDVFLFPTGMSSICNSHRTLMKARKPLKSIMFGYYVIIVTVYIPFLTLLGFPTLTL